MIIILFSWRQGAESVFLLHTQLNWLRSLARPNSALTLIALLTQLACRSYPSSVGENSLVKIFDSESSMISYTTSDGYGSTDDGNPLALGIVWNGLHPDYDYTIRLNSTTLMEVTDDTEAFDHFARTPDRVDMDHCAFDWERSYAGLEFTFPSNTEVGKCASVYYNSKFLHVQTYMVDSFLLQR